MPLPNDRNDDGTFKPNDDDGRPEPIKIPKHGGPRLLSGPNPVRKTLMDILTRNINPEDPTHESLIDRAIYTVGEAMKDRDPVTKQITAVAYCAARDVMHMMYGRPRQQISLVGDGTKDNLVTMYADLANEERKHVANRMSLSVVVQAGGLAGNVGARNGSDGGGE